MNPAAQHSKGWSGVVFCIVLLVTIFLSGTPPAANAEPSAILSYLAPHHNGLLLSGWLALPLGAFFVWFAIGLAAWLAAVDGQDEGLPRYVFAMSVVLVSLAFAGTGILSAMVLRPPGSAEIGFGWAASSLVNGPLMSMPFAVFLYAAANSMRRHDSAPGWLVWLGYLAAAGQGIASLGIFYASGMVADSIVLFGIVGFVLPALFILFTALCMIGIIKAGRAAGTAA